MRLIGFVPTQVENSKNNGTRYACDIIDNGIDLACRYFVPSHNQTGKVGIRTFHLFLPTTINKTINTYEVLGLLQAEMGKKQDGRMNFSNHEVTIINQVMDWFARELRIPHATWQWYVKFYVRAPANKSYHTEIEKKATEYWIKKTRIDGKKAHPKRICYSSQSPHTTVADNDFGTLVIEFKHNLFSQTVKRMVQKTFTTLAMGDKELNRAFLRGLIAGEATVEHSPIDGKYRIQIAACQRTERDLIQRALGALGIESKQYLHSDAVFISRKRNNVELQHQDLLGLSPEKSAQFQKMMASYKEPLTQT